jgi:hypothetical protein
MSMHLTKDSNFFSVSDGLIDQLWSETLGDYPELDKPNSLPCLVPRTSGYRYTLWTIRMLIPHGLISMCGLGHIFIILTSGGAYCQYHRWWGSQTERGRASSTSINMRTKTRTRKQENRVMKGTHKTLTHWWTTW